jgi:hypothetical protein
MQNPIPRAQIHKALIDMEPDTLAHHNGKGIYKTPESTFVIYPKGQIEKADPKGVPAHVASYILNQ